MARAEAFEAQVAALGQIPTALVNVTNALAESGTRFMPEVVVAGAGSSPLDGLAAVLTRYFQAPSGSTPEQVESESPSEGSAPQEEVAQ